MNLKKIRELDIAKKKFDFSNKSDEELNYAKWIDYIQKQTDYFTWEENTVNGKEILANLDKIPHWAKERRLISLNKRTAYAEFDNMKDYYNVIAIFRSEYNRIGINFERIPTIEDLKRFLDMANYLDAFLLSNGNDIIDEEYINSLE